MKSLRQRFTFWSLGATAALAIVAGASLYLYVRTAMYQQFDAGLRAKAQAISSLVRIEDNGSYALDFSDESMPEYLPHRKAEFFQVFLQGEKTLQRSASLRGRDLILPSSIPVGARAWNIVLPNGRAGRAMAMLAAAHPDDDDHDRSNWQPPNTSKAVAPALVVVARERSDIDRVLGALLWALIVTAVMLAAGSIGVVRFVVWQALKPVNELAARAQTIGPQTLDYRFDLKAFPEELRPICQQLNELLERLDQAFSRERRLNADIAHELRTPIAELRSLTEVASRWPVDQGRAAVYFRDAHEIALNMGSLVETLLELAHSQSGRARGKCERIELRPMVEETLTRYQEQIDNRRLVVSVVLAGDFWLMTDRTMFGRILDNLLSNCVEHASEGGQIKLVAENEGDDCVLIVANSHDSLGAADLGRMFEPFWRKDSARTDGQHAGLGLALVAEYSRELGINLSSYLDSPDWFEIRMRMPVVEFGGCEPDERMGHLPFMVKGT